MTHPLPSSPPQFPQAESAIWGNVTHPSQHDHERFRYLVHIDLGFVADLWSGRPKQSWHPTQPGIRYIDDLTALRTNSFLSTSLIDQSHRQTYRGPGEFGLILEATKRSIKATSPVDIFSWDKTKLTAALEAGPNLDPDTLLEKTSGVNEVICDGAEVTATGLIYIIGSLSYRREIDNLRISRLAAQRLALPHICINPDQG